ncbi:SOS response-associated peptidase [Denitromonas ohlonensis]|uniref:Abasic site processing protein n=2 Tax=Denitromonas TaxID=139331 RepID=A0A557S9N0_9RHOO|nr:SOS response-associated peptidase family protein [Denitromonas ohlonensis]TVO63589.1 SOS response-associated peptidase [Denitromonas ohlonensis]TVO74123.1 SOS response-associated peptidase [Denitromonas ohlonensis]
MCSNYRPVGNKDLPFFDVSSIEGDTPAGDVYPGSAAPLIYLPGDNAPRAAVMGTFGLLPFWAKEQSLARRTYNARSETVADKPSFRNAWRKRQLCIVPAMSIYEPCYETGKAVWWAIQRADGMPMALAGLWERKAWGEEMPSWSFTMLTVNANDHPVMGRFHKPSDEKRTTVILDGAQIERWLSASSEAQMRELLRPCDPDLLTTAPGRLGP